MVEPQETEKRRWPEIWLIREPDKELPYGGWRLRNPDEAVVNPYDEVQCYVPVSELEAEKEKTEAAEAATDRMEEVRDGAIDRALAAEKALKETYDLLRGIAADSADPASRACAQHWLDRAEPKEQEETTDAR